jgi:hypothetical protein
MVAMHILSFAFDLLYSYSCVIVIVLFLFPLFLVKRWCRRRFSHKFSCCIWQHCVDLIKAIVLPICLHWVVLVFHFLSLEAPLQTLRSISSSGFAPLIHVPTCRRKCFLDKGSLPKSITQYTFKKYVPKFPHLCSVLLYYLFISSDVCVSDWLLLFVCCLFYYVWVSFSLWAVLIYFQLMCYVAPAAERPRGCYHRLVIDYAPVVWPLRWCIRPGVVSRFNRLDCTCKDAWDGDAPALMKSDGGDAN